MKLTTLTIKLMNTMEGWRPRRPRTMRTSSHQRFLSLSMLLALCIGTTSFADDLNQMYEKAYFLETAKGQTEEALEPNFSAKGIHVGSSLGEVVAAFPPDRTEDRRYNIPHVGKGVLYTNMSKGPEGTHSYPTTQGVRFFFIKDKVSGLYLNKDFRPGE